MLTRLFFLIFFSSGAFAQTGTLKVVAYTDGTIKIDGEAKGSIVANEIKKFDLKADEYIVQFYPESGKNPISKEATIQIGKSEAINFELVEENYNDSKTELNKKDQENPVLLIDVNGKKLEVSKNNLGKMSRDEAIIACQSLGAGWRLPTIDELRSMHFQLNIDAKGNFGSDYYWSESKDYSSNYLLFSFKDGNQSKTSFSSISYFVRAVRVK
jgi:hypothetical protein